MLRGVDVYSQNRRGLIVLVVVLTSCALCMVGGCASPSGGYETPELAADAYVTGVLNGDASLLASSTGKQWDSAATEDMRSELFALDSPASIVSSIIRVDPNVPEVAPDRAVVLCLLETRPVSPRANSVGQATAFIRVKQVGDRWLAVEPFMPSP